jgi:transposase
MKAAPSFNRQKRKNVSVITKVSDGLWDKIAYLLLCEKPRYTIDPPIIPSRNGLDGILYVLRTEWRWKMLPNECDSGSTYHRRFQQWIKMDIFKKDMDQIIRRI